MARSLADVDESVLIHGSSVSAVMERVRLVLRDIDRCVLASSSDEVLQIARTTRRWGMRRVATCTVRAANEPRGLVVTLHGQLEARHLELVRRTLSGGAPDSAPAVVESFQSPHPQEPAAGFGPPADWFVASRPEPAERVDTGARSVPFGPPDRGSMTVHRPPPPQRAPAALHAAPNVTLRLPDGRRFPLGRLALIGRSPRPRPTEPSDALLVAIDDDALSKTHLSAGCEGSVVWIEDRNSTNGTHLVGDGGRLVALAPNERTPITAPAVVMVGDTALAIDETVP